MVAGGLIKLDAGTFFFDAYRDLEAPVKLGFNVLFTCYVYSLLIKSCYGHLTPACGHVAIYKVCVTGGISGLCPLPINFMLNCVPLSHLTMLRGMYNIFTTCYH